jgi:hypothetical protein
MTVFLKRDIYRVGRLKGSLDGCGDKKVTAVPINELGRAGSDTPPSPGF